MGELIFDLLLIVIACSETGDKCLYGSVSECGCTGSCRKPGRFGVEDWSGVRSRINKHFFMTNFNQNDTTSIGTLVKLVMVCICAKGGKWT